MTKVHGWGRYPTIDADVRQAGDDPSTLFAVVRETIRPTIARGMGRSYGDSALSRSIIDCSSLDTISPVDAQNGTVQCGAGVTLADVLTLVVPMGWFFPVTPGTKFVTVGGAIASDVHGKNHHVAGCFSQYVDAIKLALADGTILTCSSTENSDLFHATCGGMGLTGVIIDATLRLKRLKSSFVEQVTLKTRNLEEALHLFEAHQGATYSVAWIDCLASGSTTGRSLLILGEHSEDGNLSLRSHRPLSIPFEVPSQLLNRFSIKAFNWLYYNRASQDRSFRRVHYEPFFYPLDSIHHWNRLYGKRGFLQYQFVIPKVAARIGLNLLMKTIVESQRGSFLAVLKLLGQENANFLSFPLEGYTLAVDFKFEDGLLELLNELDSIVTDHGGRLYLAKDARMSEATFKRNYPRWKQFQEIRSRYGATGVFSSLQSRRIGLD